MKEVTQRQAAESLDAFVKTVASCVRDDEYELILAGGDSGHIAAWITKEIFFKLKGAASPSAVLPIFRHSDEAETILFDNRKLAPELILPEVPIKNVLVVDDEVEGGNTVRGLLAALGERVTNKPLVTFVAEEFADPIRNVLTGVVPWLNAKHIMLTLLDLPIKEMHQDRPIFTFKYRDQIKQKVSNFAELQTNFQQYLRNLISQSL